MDRSRVLPLALCALVGGLAGVVIVPVEKSQAAGEPELRLDGKPIGCGHALEAARAIARDYVSGEVTIAAFGIETKRTRQELGARPGNLEALVGQMCDPSSAMRRAHAQHAAPALSVPVPVIVDGETALDALLLVKDDLDRPAVDARLDLGKRSVVAEEEGRRVDVYGTLAKIEAAFDRGERRIEAVAETVAPARTAAQIGDVSIDDVLGYFETRYAQDKKHAARSFNLGLAASKLDGHVVMPGEIFDFNEVVGPRSEANGYKVAPVIAQGELVDGIGGGTCQVAGTLHGAAYFAGLEVVERKPHTRPSFYIKMGMDATVVYPTITLRLKNPFDFPIVLHETVRDGIVRAEILGKKRTRDVTFVRKIDEVVPFSERQADDPKIPQGVKILSQRGIPGFKVTRYRIVRDGASAVREHDTDTYPPTAQIWKVGSGPADPRYDAADDEHPEYVADEYLSISQGPHVVDPHAKAKDAPESAPTVETRVAGRYGTHGWTQREGFAKVER